MSTTADTGDAPHIATLSSATSAAPYIVENIQRVRAGLLPMNLVDRTSGY
ncbi:MAG: hypothetical protein ABW049_10340 [Spongiibacteraceae bacterium]